MPSSEPALVAPAGEREPFAEAEPGESKMFARTLTRALDDPWGLAFLPDGDLLVLTDVAPLVMSADGMGGYSFERLDAPGMSGRTLRSPAANDGMVQGERLWLGTSLGLHSVDLRTRPRVCA